MSLKAKLEAVIYAAEEPVTLNQLAALFAADALEWKAAQAAAAAEQAAEVAGVSAAAEPLPLLAEGLEYLGLSETPAVYAEMTAQAGSEPWIPPAEESAAETGGDGAETAEPVEAAPESAPAVDQAAVEVPEVQEKSKEEARQEGKQEEGTPTEAAVTPADAEAELKRQARQRDREVRAILKQLLDELIASCEADGRGVEIREIAGGYRMATKPECHDAVRLFVKSLKPALKLSLPALETLAVIAYKQPVTAPEVNEIRGVESAGVLGSLLARKLIATAGRKQVIGRPILYKTTREFLLRFGLKDVSELPSMEEFEKMAEEIEREESEPEGNQPVEMTAGGPAGQEEDEAKLEFDSPSGEELAGTSEILEGETETKVEQPAGVPAGEDEDSAVSGSILEPPAGPAEVNPADDAAATPEENEQAEIEAVPHAEEEQEKR